MQLTGRRGQITIQTTTSPRIATKHAKQTTHKACLNKEADMLEKLQAAGIGFVPQVCARGIGWFSYTWITGEHFETVYASANDTQKHHLITELLEKAYQLDKVGVVHGELARPTKNVLINKDTLLLNQPCLAIIDFERGHWHDYSGKNLRHVMQRLHRQGYITAQQCKTRGLYALDDLYTILQNHMDTHTHSKKNARVRFLGSIGLLVVIDLLTKRLLYDMRRLEATWLITPILNTGVGRSIPVPLVVTITGALLIACLLLWRSWSKKTYPWRAVFFLAGSIGNTIDRIRYGGVRDFLDLHQRPVFNLADVFLTIACLLLLIASFTDRSTKKVER